MGISAPSSRTVSDGGDLRDLRPISARLGKKVAAIRPIYDLA